MHFFAVVVIYTYTVIVNLCKYYGFFVKQGIYCDFFDRVFCHCLLCTIFSFYSSEHSCDLAPLFTYRSYLCFCIRLCCVHVYLQRVVVFHTATQLLFSFKMPVSALHHRAITGGFTGTLISLLLKKAQSFARTNKYRGLKVERRNVSQAIAVLLFALLVVHGVERNPGPGSVKGAEGGKEGGEKEGGGKQRSMRQTKLNASTSQEPTLGDIMAKLVEMDTMKSDVKTINSNVSCMKEELHAMNECVRKLQTEVDDLKDEVERLGKENSLLRKNNDDLNKRMEELEKSTEDMDSKRRKNNILVYGLKKENLNSKGVEKSMGDLLRDKLGIKNVKFEDIHILGNKPDSPVLLRCSSYSDKAKIMKEKRKLKDTNIYMKDDFTDRVRGIRKTLGEKASELKKEGKKVRLLYDCLLVDEKRMYLGSDGQTLTERKK